MSEIVYGQWRFDGTDYYKIIRNPQQREDSNGHSIKYYKKNGTWFLRPKQINKHKLIVDKALIHQLENRELTF
jgi:hypothetical protein